MLLLLFPRTGANPVMWYGSRCGRCLLQRHAHALRQQPARGGRSDDDSGASGSDSGGGAAGAGKPKRARVRKRGGGSGEPGPAVPGALLRVDEWPPEVGPSGEPVPKRVRHLAADS